MSKWSITLSTTEPFNYTRMIQVRQGNRRTEVLEAEIVENGLSCNLTGCKVYFESLIGGKYPIQRTAEIVDAEKGKVQYTFDQYSMQSLHRQTADFIIFKGDDLIGTTQDFSYFVVNAVSKSEGETGSYWQSIDDLINDMTTFISEGKGDFAEWMNARKEEFEKWQDSQKSDYETWFESIQDILKSIDPNGTMLTELMNARVDSQGERYESISDRLLADAEYIFKKLKETLFVIECGEVSVVEILQDDDFSKNHEVKNVGTVDYPLTKGALVVATIDDRTQDVFSLKKAGEIDG